MKETTTTAETKNADNDDSRAQRDGIAVNAREIAARVARGSSSDFPVSPRAGVGCAPIAGSVHDDCRIYGRRRLLHAAGALVSPDRAASASQEPCTVAEAAAVAAMLVSSV